MGLGGGSGTWSISQLYECLFDLPVLSLDRSAFNDVKDEFFRVLSRSLEFLLGKQQRRDGPSMLKERVTIHCPSLSCC